MRKFLNLTLSLSLVAVVASCGSGGSSTETKGADSESVAYPADVRDAFLTNCESSAASASGGEDADYEDTCRCLLDEIEARFSYEEFAAAEEALVAGEASDLNFEELGKLCTG